jgi:cellulose 1,4-beta-cellobiosidase
MQNGQIIQNFVVNVPGINPYDSITDDYCIQQKTVFGNLAPDTFDSMGGLPTLSEAMERGMVLVMSLTEVSTNDMNWLDSNYPPAADPSIPAVARRPCNPAWGVPAYVQGNSPPASVVFSNI